MSYSQTLDKFRQALGVFWLEIFTDANWVAGWTKAMGVPFWNLDRMAADLPNYSSRYHVPLKDVEDVRIFIFSEADQDLAAHHYGDGLKYGDGAAYGQLNPSIYNYAIDPGLSPLFLAPTVFAPTAVWQRDIDYTIANGRIIFKRNPMNLPGVTMVPTGGMNGTILRFLLWGFQTEKDLSAVQDFFGTVAGVIGPSTAQYQRAVRIAWDLRVDGVSQRNIQRLLCAITDVDYVDAAGTVRAIYVEGDRRCVLTENALYTAPLSVNLVVVHGQSLSAGQPISDAFSVRQGKEEVDFAEFGGLLLEDGLLGPGYRNGIFLENATVPVTRQHGAGWTEAEFAG